MQSEGNLADMIRQLEADRRRHATAIDAIDQVLEQVSRAVGVARLDLTEFPGALLNAEPFVAAVAPSDGRRRGKFEQTGERSVLGFIRRRGDPTTAEINAHWRDEGRRGVANVMLLKLLKQGLIHRQLDPRVRGSRYVAAAQGGGECRGLGAAGDLGLDDARPGGGPPSLAARLRRGPGRG